MQLSLDKIKRSIEGLATIIILSERYDLDPEGVYEVARIFRQLQDLKGAALNQWRDRLGALSNQVIVLRASNREAEAFQTTKVIHHIMKQNPYYEH